MTHIFTLELVLFIKFESNLEGFKIVHVKSDKGYVKSNNTSVNELKYIEIKNERLNL